jgi:hypothetical protein
MTSIEQSIKAGYAKLFSASDWSLFKQFADSYLREAAYLKKKDMGVAEKLKLLARNSRKRMLIGIGTELLLKAAYLKNGYAINKLAAKSTLVFPFTLKAAATAKVKLTETETFMLNDLIEHFHQVIQLPHPDVVRKGLRIAKVFRNKEGHVVTPAHTFDQSNYRNIEASLTLIYQVAFGQTLTVRFSVAPNEKAAWTITKLGNLAP